MTWNRRWLVLVAAAGVLSLGGCSDQTSALEWELRGVSPDGRVLTIEAFRDKCGGLAKVTSDETGEAVFI